MRANVVVDTFNIVGGPGTTQLLNVLLELNQNSSNGHYAGRGVRTLFTVKTVAGSAPFKVKVAICHLSRQPGDRPTQVFFSGMYQNTPVEGIYDYQVHQGFFNEL